MAPFHSRLLLAWTLPTVSILLTYFWFRKKRIGVRSDPGDESLEEQKIDSSQPEGDDTADRPSLIRTDSEPIDIIFPPELRSSRLSPRIVSDEELDLEIEKIKSINSQYSKSKVFASEFVENQSPVTETVQETPIEIEEEIPEVTAPVEELDQMSIRTETVVEEQKPKVVEVQIVKENFTPVKLEGRKMPRKKQKKISQRQMKQQRQQQQQSQHANERVEVSRQSSERDSANQSPTDIMLTSLSLSSISDNHSEGSNDSGKGGSEVVTPPSTTPACHGSVTEDNSIHTIYEFVLPQILVGRLIGRHGTFASEIKKTTNAHIYIKKHPTNNKLKVCAVEGLQMEVDNALEIIRGQFPLKRYPEVTLERVTFAPPITTVSLTAESLHLRLIEGINNDTVLSCMVSPNHLFLQQPTHPSHPNFNIMNSLLHRCYTESESPLLPDPIPENTVCVAQSVDAWYRAQVLSTDKDTDMSYVKFLDYGGYANIENSNLRQIRGDFLLLPFQAAECFLANIKPVADDGIWPEEAYRLVAELTSGAIIVTQIVNYTEEGIPLVLCYILQGRRYVSINQELVNRHYAEPVTYQQAEDVEGAVGGT